LRKDRSIEIMTENIENIVIEHLRTMRDELASIKEDTREIKERLTKIEEKIVSTPVNTN